MLAFHKLAAVFDEQIIHFLLVLIAAHNIGHLYEYEFDLLEVELKGEQGFRVVGLDDVVDHALVLHPFLADIHVNLLIVIDILDIIDQQLIDLPVLVLLLIADKVLQQDLDKTLLELHHKAVAVDQRLELLVPVEKIKDDE